MQVVSKTIFGNIPKKSAAQYNEDIQVEINVNKVDINKMTFYKTRDEKESLRKAKKAHKKSGSHERDELIKTMLGNRIPRWGATSRFTFA